MVKICFKSFSAPYVRGDVISVEPELAKRYVDQGSADFVVPEVSKPAEKQPPAVPKKRGRPRKNPAPPVDESGE